MELKKLPVIANYTPQILSLLVSLVLPSKQHTLQVQGAAGPDSG